MQNLQNELIDLLKHEDNLVVDGHLNKNKIIELALKVEPQLISLLLKNETFKKYFFQEVSTVLVFDKIKFQRFVNNKSFLPDSYTAFKNKIGLITNDNDLDNFISTSNDVVLAWPHKDCVLEGGQTKEDQKINETFWNETLAPDSVDRLLDAKVFTNFKMFNKNGEHKVNELKGDENLIIKGNNLLALASLLKTHRGKIKLIYIDPPYNTGNDGFNYNDSFNHSSWLTFMKNRLTIARQLLTNDGIIFISCDDNEVAYLKVLMDELFKQENFIDIFSWKKTDTPSNLPKKSKKVVEYILCYEKNKDSVKFKGVEKNSTSSNGLMNKTNSVGILAFPANFVETGLKNGLYEKGKYGTDSYDIYLLEDTEVKDGLFVKEVKLKGNFKWGQKKLENEITNGTSISIRTKSFSPSYEKQEYDIEAPLNYIDSKMGVQTTESAGKDLTKIFGKEVFSYPKSESLIMYLINMVSNKLTKDDYILDFHIGSGTTCATAHKLGYKYIGIEQMDYINTVTVERMKFVINGEQTGISELVNWEGGGSFVYAELMQHNQRYIELIQDASTKEILINIWKEMHEKAFLNYRFNKLEFEERIDGFKTAPIEEMKKYLVEVLDKNQLYVNYSEIEDKSYNISDDIKKVNYSFYKSSK
ncbi:DNA methyltransferase [Flavobacterium lacustre]|uniref:DNA methyltransferase n=1 Tax=Flavobacterium lacustre TaxID=3016339 RepID=UPI0022B73141|nr:site-specific DNA-methyltransferase [Flavobacterium lacustre]